MGGFIKVRQNGPYLVDVGEDVKLVDWEGREYEVRKRPFTLCRCGASTTSLSATVLTRGSGSRLPRRPWPAAKTSPPPSLATRIPERRSACPVHQWFGVGRRVRRVTDEVSQLLSLDYLLLQQPAGHSFELVAVIRENIARSLVGFRHDALHLVVDLACGLVSEGAPGVRSSGTFQETASFVRVEADGAE
jgi:hypothetical protein